MSISVWDTKDSMLSSLLLVIEKIKVRLAIATPAGAPTTLANEMIQTPLFVALKTIKILFI